MKVLQTITLKLICVGLLVCAVALLIYPVDVLYEMVSAHVPESAFGGQILRIFVGIAGCAIAFWGLVPLSNGRSRKKTISFPDAQGTTTVHLDSIEKTLNQEIARQPEIKRVAIQIEPADDNRRVRILARVVIRKGSGASTRDIYSRMKAFIVEEARNILGPDEVAGLDLDVEGIIPDKRPVSKLIEEAPIDFEKKTEPETTDSEADEVSEYVEEPEPEVGESPSYAKAGPFDDTEEDPITDPSEPNEDNGLYALRDDDETPTALSALQGEGDNRTDEEKDETSPSILDVEPIDDDANDDGSDETRLG